MQFIVIITSTINKLPANAVLGEDLHHDSRGLVLLFELGWMRMGYLTPLRDTSHTILKKLLHNNVLGANERLPAPRAVQAK